MTLEQQPFVRYHEKKKLDSFSVRLNEEERKTLNSSKLILEQPKDSTALKTLAIIGAKVIHSNPTLFTIKLLFKNKRNNKRLGIVDYD